MANNVSNGSHSHPTMGNFGSNQGLTLNPMGHSNNSLRTPSLSSLSYRHGPLLSSPQRTRAASTPAYTPQYGQQVTPQSSYVSPTQQQQQQQASMSNGYRGGHMQSQNQNQQAQPP